MSTLQQLSQFWYNNSTVRDLVKIAKKTLNPGDKLALISCPTLYKLMKDELETNCEGMISLGLIINAYKLFNIAVHLYEYDLRFSVFGSDFIKYDYNTPLKVPQIYQEYYDLVIADPPFLSEECLTKTAETIKYICKEKIILCTGNLAKIFLMLIELLVLSVLGATMSSLAKVLLNLDKVNFEPTHRSNLANEFYCFSNYDIDSLL